MKGALCGCGCGLPAPIAEYTSPKRGWVKGRPLPYRRGHQRKSPGYKVDSKSGCWDWRGYINPAGYGRVRLGTRGRVVMAHRMVWERENGQVPPGMELHHACGNRGCVNPNHMELLVVAEHRRLSGNRKLSPNMAHDIRMQRKAGARVADLAALYGVAKQTIYSVVKGTMWPEDIGRCDADH